MLFIKNLFIKTISNCTKFKYCIWIFINCYFSFFTFSVFVSLIKICFSKNDKKKEIQMKLLAFAILCIYIFALVKSFIHQIQNSSRDWNRKLTNWAREKKTRKRENQQNSYGTKRMRSTKLCWMKCTQNIIQSKISFSWTWK